MSTPTPAPPRSPRRRWLIGAGIGVAVIALAAVVYTAFGPTPTPTHAGAGGGAASGSAPVSLTATSAAGQQVTVLEARRRTGGRAWTSRRWPDLPVDLGASWIHGASGNPLVPLARAAGARPVPFDPDLVRRFWAEGGRLSAAHNEQLDRLIGQLYARLEAAEERPERRAAEVLAPLSGSDPRRERLLAYARSSELEHNWGSPPEELSIGGFLEGREERGGDLLFPGQAGLLTDSLAATLGRLGGEVRQDCPVSRVSLTPRGVRAQTAAGPLDADLAVVTVPLGVLQASGLGLPLEKEMRAALNELKMGSLEKLVLRFPRVFWPNTNYLVLIPERGHEGEWIDTLNLHRFTGQPALMLFNAGTVGRRTARQEDRELVAGAMRALRRVFPGAPDPTAAQRSRWDTDPWTLGSYSFGRGEDPGAARRALQTPLGGRIWLAGEHTSVPAPQTLHGAYLEGLRVARAALLA